MKNKKMNVKYDDKVFQRAKSVARYLRTLEPSVLAGFLIQFFSLSGEVTTSKRLSKKLMEFDSSIHNEVMPLIEMFSVNKRTIKLSELISDLR
ncbi:MAG: hypothetical protein HQM14_18210 [SAR324 cluster bacterium]|nr:hypothetical protein [SAR324 cluster bacterium]